MRRWRLIAGLLVLPLHLLIYVLIKTFIYIARLVLGILLLPYWLFRSNAMKAGRLHSKENKKQNDLTQNEEEYIRSLVAKNLITQIANGDEWPMLGSSYQGLISDVFQEIFQLANSYAGKMTPSIRQCACICDGHNSKFIFLYATKAEHEMSIQKRIPEEIAYVVLSELSKFYCATNLLGSVHVLVLNIEDNYEYTWQAQR